MKYALVLFIAVAALFAAPVSRAHDEVSKHTAVWFEIPVTDMDRAVVFYETIFDVKLRVDRKPDFAMAFFPGDHDTVTGALVQYKEATPGNTGPVVYLNGGADLLVVQGKIEAAGGKVLIPKTLISPEVGYFAIFLDTEGNRLGLFSSK